MKISKPYHKGNILYLYRVKEQELTHTRSKKDTAEEGIAGRDERSSTDSRHPVNIDIW